MAATASPQVTAPAAPRQPTPRAPGRPLLADQAEAALQIRVTDSTVHVDHALFEALEQIQVERPLVHDVADLHPEPVPEERQEPGQRVHEPVHRLADAIANAERFEERHDDVRTRGDPIEAERLAEVLTALHEPED